MKTLFGSTILTMALAGSSVLTLAIATPSAAQTSGISLPAMSLADALRRIEAETHVVIVWDPDAVRPLTSTPVVAARDARDAVRQATRGHRLSIETDHAGVISVASEIVVVAQRDEAETGLLVRGTSTSTRTGRSVRDQPRNVQVISSKLIKEQQAQTVIDALRNAGGVSVSTATVQGGAGYSVRGFGSGGLVNGLPAAGSDRTGIAGTTQPIANIERIEVLKGPDALLAGAENQGGTINLVTKKPSADPFLDIVGETGSFGQARLTIDGNQALNADRTISARVIGVKATSDRSYGGYRGNKEFLFAPSIRFKNATTDLILGATVGEQQFGPAPYIPLNIRTNRPYDVRVDRPLFRVKDQGIDIDTTQFNVDLTRKVTDWLTVVVRGQHQKTDVDVGVYAPFGNYPDGSGRMAVSNRRLSQSLNSDAVDAYARLKVRTGPVDHTLIAGYSYFGNDATSFSASGGTMFDYNFLTATAPPRALAPVDTKDSIVSSTQNGYYAQYLAKLGKLSVIAGVRRNVLTSRAIDLNWDEEIYQRGVATTPNYGAVFDVTGDLSLFGSLAYGYSPTFALGRDRRKLPDVRTRNAEAGAKLELFGDRVLINASYFELRQSNLLISDPSDFRFQIAVPGQQGKGIDLNVSGEIVGGWTVQGSYTRTKYSDLTESIYGNVVVGQPQDQYSLYSTYRHKLDTDLSAGLGGGVFGRSSAAVDSFGTYSVPASLQVDLNGFLKFGMLDVNLGVRNLFDRRNYNITYSSSYLPVSEPRNWRLTVGYRFK